MRTGGRGPDMRAGGRGPDNPNTLKVTPKMRSSCSQMFCEIGVPKNFAKFTGKHLGWSHLLINLQVFTGNPKANIFLEHLKFTRNDDISSWEVSVLEYEHLLGIVFTGRTRHFSQL